MDNITARPKYLFILGILFGVVLPIVFRRNSAPASDWVRLFFACVGTLFLVMALVRFRKQGKQA